MPLARRSPLSALAAGLLLAGTLAACGAGTATVEAPPATTASQAGASADSQPSGTGAAAAPAPFSTVDAPTFAQAVAIPGTTLLDVRTPAEFAEGHLAGAVNVDWDSGTYLEQIKAYDKTKAYALYCRSGNRSAQAMSAMKDAGFTNVYDLGGGIGAWAAAGGKFVTG